MAKFFTKTIIIFLSLFALSPLLVNAATLSFFPSSGSYSVGSTFSVSVYTGSTDQAMNAASGVISFPKNLLEVTSVSKTGSIFSLWVQDPSFSNTAGTVTFEGIVLNPGFTGSSGKIVTVTFRVKSTGSANLNFSSGSVLANDGSGTNILSTLGTANFDLVGGSEPVVAPEPTPKVNISGLPMLPEVTSSTNPDTSKWYQNPNPELAWKLSSDITSVQTLVGSRPVSVPTVLYSPPIEVKKLENMSDGTWYFHIRFENENGFGPTADFRLNIDTTPPESFYIKEVTRTDNTLPKVGFIFSAKDKTSGIDHYDITIDGNPKDSWKDDGSHNYVTDVLLPGTHTLIGKAVDAAGNSRANSIDFSVDPISPPTIDEYPNELESGQPMVIKGHGVYGVDVTLYLSLEKNNPEIYPVKTDQNGKFTLTIDKKLKSGIYRLWAINTDSRGAQSLPSEKVLINVSGLSLLHIGSLAVNVLDVVIPLIALLVLLTLLLLWSWKKFSLSKERLRKEVRDVESGLHKAFHLLRDDIQKQVKSLEKVKTKRKLTKEEERIINRFKKNLDDVEKFVDREIEDI